jgi:hypothetical protein
MITLDKMLDELECAHDHLDYESAEEAEQAIRDHVSAIEAERDEWKRAAEDPSWTWVAPVLSKLAAGISDSDATISDLLDQCEFLRCEMRAARSREQVQRDRAERAERELASVISAAHGAGWNGVENSKLLPTFIADMAAERDVLRERARLARGSAEVRGNALERAERERDEMRAYATEEAQLHRSTAKKLSRQLTRASARARLWKRAAKRYRESVKRTHAARIDIASALREAERERDELRARLAKWESASRCYVVLPEGER